MLKRQSATLGQASRRSHAFSAFVILLVVTVLLLVGITCASHGYMNVVVAAVLVVTAVWRLGNNREERPV